MVQEPELEEREACWHKDDTNMDPDIALSYIGDKVESILGHFQKDFEGGVSAETLGAKFGGYGSFLPMYQRSPSIWLQHPKSPRKDILRKSPNHLIPEGPAASSVMVPNGPSTQRNGSGSSCNMRPSETLKASSVDALVSQNASLCSDDIVTTFTSNVELPLSKLGNPTNPRTLKVRIKVGDRAAAEMYNLGLASSSSSEGDSPEESGRLLLGSNEPSSVSPASILQTMTSSPLSGALLLSPLNEDLLNIVRQMESSGQGEFDTAPKNSAISVKILNRDVFVREKAKYADKAENIVRSENECMKDLDDSKRISLGSVDLGCRLDSYCDTVRETGRDVLIKKRKGSKDRVKGKGVSSAVVKDASFERTSIRKHEQRLSGYSVPEKAVKHRTSNFDKDVSVGCGKDGWSTVAGDGASFKAYSDNCASERTKVVMGNVNTVDHVEAASAEQDELGMAHSVNQLVLEGEKKSSGSRSSGKWSSKSADGVCVPKKAYNEKNVFDRGHLSQIDVVDKASPELMENPKLLVGRTSGGWTQSNNLETSKSKHVFTKKLKEGLSNKKHVDNRRSQLHRTEPPVGAVSSDHGVNTGLGQTVAAPVVVEENWVACDHCEKWRLLPYGTRSDQLPEVWVCSMLDWLPGMNHCDISEDETTNAVQAGHLVPVTVNSNNFQAYGDRTLSGLSSTVLCHYDQNHWSNASDHIAGHVKRQEQKEKLKAVGMSNSAASSDGKKELHRRPVKKGISKEVNQSLTGLNATFSSHVHHADNPASAVSIKNNLHDRHVTGDDENPRKKSRKEPVPFLEQVETIISRGVLNVAGIQTAGANLDMTDHRSASMLPTKVAVKNGKSASKHVNSEGMSSIKIRVKRKKDQMVTSSNNGPSAVKSCSGEEINLKKRKLKDSKDSQHLVVCRQNNLKGADARNISFKDNDFHEHKKQCTSQNEEEELKLIKCDNTSNVKVPEPRVRFSGRRECPTGDDFGKEQQERTVKAETPLTIEDIDKLRKDLGYEPPSTAATSSSSKVSDSHKNRIGYMEAKGSPSESISSSPVRVPYPNQVSLPMIQTVGNIHSGFNDLPAIGNGEKNLFVNGGTRLRKARKGMVTTACYPDGDFRESDVRDEPIKLLAVMSRPPEFVQNPLVGNPYPNSVHIINHSHSKEGSSKDHSKLPQLKSRKSSSLRSLTKCKISGTEKVESASTGVEAFYSIDSSKEEVGADNNYGISQYEVSNKNRDSSSDEFSIKSVRNNMIVGRRNLGKRPDCGNGNQSSQRVYDVKPSVPCSYDLIQHSFNQDFVESSLEQTRKCTAEWSGKVRIDLRQGNKQGTLYSSKPASSLGSLKRSYKDSKPLDASIGGTPKPRKDEAVSRHQNGSSNFINHTEAETTTIDASITKDVSADAATVPLKEAGDAFKEAEELRNHADLLKNSGFGSESNYEYFIASLKFLYGAFLLEAAGESTKHLELNPMQLYSTAAKICKTCAYEYEKANEITTAALAYKCVEVAYMKIAFGKSLTANRYLHDLQSTMQMIPQGESPSSSASDVDNLNNLAIGDRASLSKGNGLHSGNHVIPPRNRANFIRLLDYTKDVNLAMEATRKFQDIFAAAHVKLDEYWDKESSIAVKRALLFSFHDVEEFVRLVRLAFDAINRQGLSGSGEQATVHVCH